VFWVPAMQAGDRRQPLAGVLAAGEGHRVARRGSGGGGGICKCGNAGEIL
jgi:hypothetical protein